jgi:patatin-like phospholipase/acyl hydrolase
MRLIDGGVWANNPTMVGIAEAVSMNVRSGTKDHSNPSRISCVSAEALAKAR